MHFYFNFRIKAANFLPSIPPLSNGCKRQFIISAQGSTRRSTVLLLAFVHDSVQMLAARFAQRELNT